MSFDLFFDLTAEVYFSAVFFFRSKYTWYTTQSVALVAFQVILEPGIGHFREFESPRVHTHINSWGLFFLRTN